MREIKFRAWNKINKNFVYATLQDFWVNGWHCAEGHLWNKDDPTFYKPTPKIAFNDGVYTKDSFLKKDKNSFYINADWKQYTGLKAKNGVEIYEGDIISTDYKFSKPRIGEVKLKYGSFVACSGSQKSGEYSEVLTNTMCAGYIKVIGNIYEYPHLLEEEREDD